MPRTRENYNPHNERPTPTKIGFIMNKIEVFKFAARLVVGVGTTTITNSVIRNNISPSNPLEVVSTAVASVVIGSMASQATRSHTDTQIDGLVEAWNSARSTEPTTA